MAYPEIEKGERLTASRMDASKRLATQVERVEFIWGDGSTRGRVEELQRAFRHFSIQTSDLLSRLFNTPDNQRKFMAQEPHSFDEPLTDTELYETFVGYHIWLKTLLDQLDLVPEPRPRVAHHH